MSVFKNWRHRFYWMHFAFVSLKSGQIVSYVIINQDHLYMPLCVLLSSELTAGVIPPSTTLKSQNDSITMGALMWPSRNHSHLSPMTTIPLDPSHWQLLIFIFTILSPQGCSANEPRVCVTSGDWFFPPSVFLGTHPSCYTEVVCSTVECVPWYVYSPVRRPGLLLVFVIINKPAMNICGSISV